MNFAKFAVLGFAAALYVSPAPAQDDSDLALEMEAQAADVIPVTPAPAETPAVTDTPAATTPVTPAPQEHAAVEPVPVPSEETPMVLDQRPTIRDGSRQYIKHPNASKGLRLIDRDGAYYYTPYKTSKNEQTSSLRFGPIQPHPAIEAEGGITNYGRMYGDDNPFTINYDYEWKPWQGFGQIGLQLGGGFFTSQGQGEFKNQNVAAQYPEGPREKYTFFAIPLNAGIIYRLEFMKRQWLAPYVTAGGSVFNLLEFRDDDKAPSLAFSPAVYGGGGLLINISALDRDTGFSLDAEYGISTLWLSMDVRQIEATNKKLDISGTLLSFGVSMDY